MEGVKNLVVKKHNLPVTKIVDELMEIKQGSYNEEYLYFDPKILRGQDNIPRAKNPFQVDTIEKKFLIWISRSFKNGASDKTISHFDQSFRFFGLWLILVRDLGRSGQNKSWGNRKQGENQ